MTIIFVLIPLGLMLLAAAVLAFFWAVGSGQFDDLETPAWRILMDDDRRPPPGRPAGDADRSPVQGRGLREAEPWHDIGRSTAHPSDFSAPAVDLDQDHGLPPAQS